MTTTTDREARRKSRVGRVVSDAMDKTVVVAVERRVPHPLYHKSVRRVKKYKAHDEENAYKVGDVVRLLETRPLSRTKRWRVAELIQREEVVEALAAAEAQPEADAVAAPAPVAETQLAVGDDAADYTVSNSTYCLHNKCYHLFIHEIH